MQDSRAGDDRRVEFETRGWTVLRGVVAGRQLAELNRIFDELIASQDTAPAAGRRGVVLLPQACRQHDAMLRHLYDGVAETVCHLLRTSSIRLLQDGLLLKHPSANGSIALHQDYSYTGFLDPPAIVSVGLALTDASLECGCLYVVDASHTWGLLGGYKVFASELHEDLDALLSPAQRDALAQQRIPLEVRAGDVTIHHCLTLHGSDDNTSHGPRKTIVTHLFSGACRLVRGRVPAQYCQHFVTDDEGRLAEPGFPTLFSMLEHTATA